MYKNLVDEGTKKSKLLDSQTLWQMLQANGKLACHDNGNTLMYVRVPENATNAATIRQIFVDPSVSKI